MNRESRPGNPDPISRVQRFNYIRDYWRSKESYNPLSFIEFFTRNRPDQNNSTENESGTEHKRRPIPGRRSISHSPSPSPRWFDSRKRCASPKASEQPNTSYNPIWKTTREHVTNPRWHDSRSSDQGSRVWKASTAAATGGNLDWWDPEQGGSAMNWFDTKLSPSNTGTQEFEASNFFQQDRLQPPIYGDYGILGMESCNSGGSVLGFEDTTDPYSSSVYDSGNPYGPKGFDTGSSVNAGLNFDPRSSSGGPRVDSRKNVFGRKCFEAQDSTYDTPGYESHSGTFLPKDTDMQNASHFASNWCDARSTESCMSLPFEEVEPANSSPDCDEFVNMDHATSRFYPYDRGDVGQKLSSFTADAFPLDALEWTQKWRVFFLGVAVLCLAYLLFSALTSISGGWPPSRSQPPDYAHNHPAPPPPPPPPPRGRPTQSDDDSSTAGCDWDCMKFLFN